MPTPSICSSCHLRDVTCMTSTPTATNVDLRRDGRLSRAQRADRPLHSHEWTSRFDTRMRMYTVAPCIAHRYAVYVCAAFDRADPSAKELTQAAADCSLAQSFTCLLHASRLSLCDQWPLHLYFAPVTSTVHTRTCPHLRTRPCAGDGFAFVLYDVLLLGIAWRKLPFFLQICVFPFAEQHVLLVSCCSAFLSILTIESGGCRLAAVPEFMLM